MSQRSPLAVAILLHNKKRLAVAVTSIAFASILMFQQQGYKHALYDSSSEIVRLMQGELIVFSRARFAVSAEQRFSRHVLEQLAGLPGVTAATPIYLEHTAARLRAIDEPTGPATAGTEGRESPGRVRRGSSATEVEKRAYEARQQARPIRVIGVPLDRLPLALPLTAADVERLAMPRTAYIDRRSKPQYGVSFETESSPSQTVELSNQRLQIRGTFELGQDFVHDGNLLMSSENLARYFPYRAARPLDQVDLGVIQLAAGQEPHRWIAEWSKRFPTGVEVLPLEAYVQRESQFWAKSTPIGVIFNVGAVMGFVVGVIICYQILVDDISQQIGEYATLKAMGYSNGFLCRLVMQQAGLLAVGSFLPSLLATAAAFSLTYLWTGLKMELTPMRTGLILSLTLGMCLISSLLAIRRLLAADPASLFR